jgi:site-specific recombinase XerD
MFRHACGYKLANDGRDTRALQHYLGHKSAFALSGFSSADPHARTARG